MHGASRGIKILLLTLRRDPRLIKRRKLFEALFPLSITYMLPKRNTSVLGLYLAMSNSVLPSCLNPKLVEEIGLW